MADDRDQDDRRSAGDEATVQIPAELLSILPPPPEAAAPPPPGPAASDPPPPPPPAGVADPAPPPPGRVPVGEEPRGGSAFWLLAALGVVALFVVVCYLVVIRAEDGRPTTSPGVTPTSEDGTATTASTTTAPTPTTQDPASLGVVVLNGTGQPGWAGENVAKLAEAGYQADATDARSEDIPTTTVYIAREELAADGAAVATAVGLPDAPVELRPEEPLGVTPAADGADVVVLLGADSIG